MSDQHATWTIGPPAVATVFRHTDGHLRLIRLCGQQLGHDGADSGPASTRGTALLCVDGQRREGDDLVLDSVELSSDHVRGCWRVAGSALRLTTTWTACAVSGIVSRRDTVTNTGDTAVVLSRCLARVTFPPGAYACYTQASRWCAENQGAWQGLHTGLRLRHAPGRTTQETTPYLALRADGASAAVAFHVLPRGNWTLAVRPVAEGGERPFACVELGLADENLHLRLPPGDELELPEILFQPLPQGAPHLGAPLLHRYLLAHHFAAARPQAPVVFNTWFHEFDTLDIPRLRAQLKVAARVGCEVFVIDAGWYGAGGPDWSAQTGDWREKTEAAFRGDMRAFAVEVRDAGLGFGLWMEPERFGPQAPVRAAHPEWFVRVGDVARMDLTHSGARAWLRAEIGRLVETYELAWMKVDFNFALDTDAGGAELHAYHTAWYALLDEIRAAYPGTFFEGCSSGALRSDLATVSHFDGHFLTDTVNPVDVLRISQGAWLRLPPGRLTRWAVLASAAHAVPRYGMGVADSPPTILTPAGALWEPAESVDLDFVLLAAMPGMLGFSGDLASLEQPDRERTAAAIAFYKEWRRYITGAVAHLLTPPEPLGHREGWIAVQLQKPGTDSSLVFVYRLGSAGAAPPVCPRGLTTTARYTVTRGFGANTTATTCDGAHLMRAGLTLDGPWPFTCRGGRAEVFTLVRE